MKKIEYNIAGHKKIDLLKFVLFAALVLIFSFIFIFVGSTNLARNKEVRENELKALNEVNSKLSYISDKSQQYKEEISNTKSQWSQKVNFANSLISKKEISILRRLNLLEETLPPGVLISKLTLSIDSKSNININIMADSFARLMEAYKNFAKYDLIVKNEVESNGLYRANLVLKMKDEKN